MSGKKISKKYTELKMILKGMGKVLVAFSGGVDSSFLTWAAVDALGKDNVIAVTAESPTRHSDEIEMAKKIAQQLEIEHIIVKTVELEDKMVSNNSYERCYYCKKYIFNGLVNIAGEHNVNHILEGSNIDDDSQFRPGKKAIEELNVKSPLAQAGLTKPEIRKLAKKLGVFNWNASSQSCLLTRFTYNRPVSESELNKIHAAENFLMDMGFTNVRVRVYSRYIRLEVAPAEVPVLTEKAPFIISQLKTLGYEGIKIDPAGYRSGSMDKHISWIKNA